MRGGTREFGEQQQNSWNRAKRPRAATRGLTSPPFPHRASPLQAMFAQQLSKEHEPNHYLSGAPTYLDIFYFHYITQQI